MVVREALLVQQLNHRVHKSLCDSSLALSKFEALRRTTTRTQLCVRLGLNCLFNSETTVENVLDDW